jgi:hypothetical protein
MGHEVDHLTPHTAEVKNLLNVYLKAHLRLPSEQ